MDLCVLLDYPLTTRYPKTNVKPSPGVRKKHKNLKVHLSYHTLLQFVVTIRLQNGVVNPKIFCIDLPGLNTGLKFLSNYRRH